MDANGGDVARGAHVLVADDEEILRVMIARGFRRAGFTVSEAADGEEAIAQFEREAGIGLVILDVAMPKKDGLAVFDHIRARTAPSPVPVVFITGHASDPTELADRLLLTGVTIVIKTFMVKDLVARARTLLATSPY